MIHRQIPITLVTVKPPAGSSIRGVASLRLGFRRHFISGDRQDQCVWHHGRHYHHNAMVLSGLIITLAERSQLKVEKSWPRPHASRAWANWRSGFVRCYSAERIFSI